jgi:hypothetical protein
MKGIARQLFLKPYLYLVSLVLSVDFVKILI